MIDHYDARREIENTLIEGDDLTIRANARRAARLIILAERAHEAGDHEGERLLVACSEVACPVPGEDPRPTACLAWGGGDR